MHSPEHQQFNVKSSTKNSAKDIPQSKKNIFSRDWFLIFILITLCTYLFIFKLGKPSLWNTDEAIYGEVAKEILKFNDWLTLRFNYRVWFDKPPLYMWLTALNFRFFGQNEFTTRIWSALFGVGGVVVVYFLGKSIFNKRSGFLAGLILATSFQYIITSRLALLDIPLNFFVSLSLLFFYLAHKTSWNKMFYLLFFASMALATLTKGPIGVILPLLIIGLYLLLTRQVKTIKKVWVFWGGIVYLVIAAPWYLAEFWLYGREFLNDFFFRLQVQRYLTSFAQQPVWYYIPVLILGLFPWSPFLFYSFARLAISKVTWQSEEGKKWFFILTWFGVIFIFFFLAKSKNPSYILPLYPVLALAVGKVWSDSFIFKKQSFGKGMIFSFFLLLFLLVALLYVAVAIVKPNFPTTYNQWGGKDIILMIIVSIIGSILSLLIGFFKGSNASFGVMVGTMCVLTWILTGNFVFENQRFRPTKVLSQKIIASISPGEKIGNYPAFDSVVLSFNCSLIYYSDRPVKGINDKEKLIKFLNSGERVYCLMSEKSYQKVREDLKRSPVYILDKKGGKILLSNRGDLSE